MKHLKRTMIMMVAIFVSSNTALAQTPEEKGFAISMKVVQSDNGWKDSKFSMQMELINKQGQTTTLKARQKTLEVKNDGDKSLIIFDGPRDVKDTAFLSYSHSIRADEQWLYLPAGKRVKRISSQNKSSSFIGSEFSFEDLSSFEIEKFSYKYIEDLKSAHGTMHVVEQYPTDQNSGYGKRIVWINAEHFYPEKIDFYDRKKSLLKTLVIEEYTQYLNKYWRAGTMKMTNHQTGKSTVLTMTNYDFGAGLRGGDFTRRALQRTR